MLSQSYRIGVSILTSSVLLWIFVLIASSSTKPLNLPSSQPLIASDTNLADLAQNQSFSAFSTDDLLSTLNLTLPSLFNLSSSYQCHRGAASLTLQQCNNALETLPPWPDLWTHQVSWGPREYGIYDVGLPRRYLSCTYIPFVPAKSLRGYYQTAVLLVYVLKPMA